jgi:hypothetical protein
MYPIVHDTKENSERGLVDIGMPAVQEDRNMMIPVQKDEFLFVNYNKESIKKFPASI